MIDEKKLIECLAHDMSCFETDDKKISQLYVRVDDMVRMINGQPKIGGWIPCSERLPESGGTYLVTATENGLYHTTFVRWQPRYKKWDLTGARAYWKIIAWQPLPEAYHE